MTTDWERFRSNFYIVMQARETDVTDKREYSRDEPVAMDDRDPSNSEPDQLTEPLEPGDNVYQVIFQDQGDIRETAPMQEPTFDA